MPLFWDNTYYLVLIGAIISAIASWNVSRTYNRYSRILSRRGVPAQTVARAILDRADCRDVTVAQIRGSLTDHYSPKEKVLRLSDSVYGSASVAAIGVAAHECGHAIQHRVGYGPLKLRSLSVPVANIGSRLSWPLLLLGIFLGIGELATAGVILFSAVVVFQLITLPVEFNASRRAKEILQDAGLLSQEELLGAKKVLGAAALTYVAALFSSVLQLFRLLLLSRNTRRRD